MGCGGTEGKEEMQCIELEGINVISPPLDEPNRPRMDGMVENETEQTFRAKKLNRNLLMLFS